MLKTNVCVHFSWFALCLFLLCGVFGIQPHVQAAAQAQKTRLIFEIDEGYKDTLIVRLKDNMPELDRCLGNIYDALADLSGKYNVSVQISPAYLYNHNGFGNPGAGPIDRISPALLHTMDFFRAHTKRGKITVFLDMYSSNILTTQSGHSGNLQPSTLTGNPGDSPRLGLAMDLNALAALKDAYPGVLQGIRFHEIYGEDINWAISPANDKRGFKLDPGVIRGCVDLCQRKNLVLVWSDSSWLAKYPATTGEPNYVYSNVHQPYAVSEPFQGLQNEAAKKLGRNVCFDWANNNYHFTPNLDFLDARIGPSKPGIIRPIPSWLYFSMPFTDFPLKDAGGASWGMSVQSWFWHEMTDTLNGRYYNFGEMECPVELMEVFTLNGLRRGAAVLQYEPSWYFFNEPLADHPEYKGYFEDSPDESERISLKRLKYVLLHPDSPDNPPANLSAIFDKDQQRFHENDSSDPPRNFAQTTLGFLWHNSGALPVADYYDFYSYGPKWLHQSLNRFSDSIFAGEIEDVDRISLSGNGTDQFLVVRKLASGQHGVSFYSQYDTKLSEDDTLATDNQDGKIVALTALNILPEIVNGGDPDEIVVARQQPGQERLNLRIYKMTVADGDTLQFHYAPLSDDQNKAALLALVGTEPTTTTGFVAMLGMRAGSQIYTDGTRPTGVLAFLRKTTDGCSLSLVQTGIRQTTQLSPALAHAQSIVAKAIDIDLNGVDGVCIAWQANGLWKVANYHMQGHVLSSGPPRILTMPAGDSGRKLCLLSVGRRIPVNAGKG